MTTATLTEALYLGQGLKLHSNFLDFINRGGVHALALLFGVMFMVTTIRYFSRYFPGNAGFKNSGLFDYVKIFFAMVIGMSILKANTSVSVRNFSGEEWAKNPRFVSVKGGKEVKSSFLFYLLGGTASGVATKIEENIDRFVGKQAQTRRPNEMIRLVVNSSLAQIGDDDLRAKSHLLFDECSNIEGVELLRQRARISSASEKKLRAIEFQTNQGVDYNCLSLLQEVRAGVAAEAKEKNERLYNQATTVSSGGPHGMVHIQDPDVIGNAMLINLLNTRAPKQDLAPSPGGGIGSAIVHHVMRFFSSGPDTKANEAMRKKAKEYESAERLAPHFIGFVKMILIALFPFLVFPLVLGHWRIMALWSLAFFSVCMWSPIWTLMHHCFVEVSQMTSYFKTAQHSALLQDEVASELVSMYIVFVSLQLAVAPAFSFFFLSSLKPLLAANASNVASQNPVGHMIQTGTSVASALSFTMPVAKIGGKALGTLSKARNSGSMVVRPKRPQIILPGSPAFSQVRSTLAQNLKATPKSKQP